VEQTVGLDPQEKAGVVVERLLEGAVQQANIRRLEGPDLQDGLVGHSLVRLGGFGRQGGDGDRQGAS
jgi:hypothetical protein